MNGLQDFQPQILHWSNQIATPCESLKSIGNDNPSTKHVSIRSRQGRSLLHGWWSWDLTWFWCRSRWPQFEVKASPFSNQKKLNTLQLQFEKSPNVQTNSSTSQRKNHRKLHQPPKNPEKNVPKNAKFWTNRSIWERLALIWESTHWAFLTSILDVFSPTAAE